MDRNPERARVEAASVRAEHWRRWGPYLSDRQWGTVREDYSPDGRAWDYFPFEMARLRAYRWGEDGILGISDNHQRLCIAPAFWNERDEIVKERFYGLGGNQGNHGEDVKEYWWYLDAVPSHAYLKALYRYPQRAFPYAQLRDGECAARPRRARVRARRHRHLRGRRLLRHHGRVRQTRRRRRPHAHHRHQPRARERAAARAAAAVVSQRVGVEGRHRAPDYSRSDRSDGHVLVAEHATLGKRWIFTAGDETERLFTENDTDFERAFGVPSPSPYVKSGIDRAVRGEDRNGINPGRVGSKAALHYRWSIEPGATRTVRLRITDDPHASGIDDGFDATFDLRAHEADRFYAALARGPLDEESAMVQRRAFAGMIWSKQFYNYVVRDWLNGDPLTPPPPESRKHGRNSGWMHVYNDDVLSMPDTWEYPWFAAWDLAFHVIPFGLIDPEFGKRQLTQLTREWYMHPSGQLPAYEWAFDDVNPPVHAWAALRLYRIEAKRNGGAGDFRFLERTFQKLLMNFTWWVNRKDVSGRNVFQGGFLGLDNIGPFDRSRTLPQGAFLAQSDGTSWMAVYALNMLAIAIELAKVESIYEDVASKFFEHFLIIADAMNSQREDEFGLWDAGDEFYYDQLYLPDGERIPLKVRSVVGIVPVFAAETFGAASLGSMEQLPHFNKRVAWFLAQPPGADGEHRALRRRRDAGAAAAGDLQPGPLAQDPAARVRRERVPLAARRAHAVALPSGAPVRAQAGRRGVPRRLRAGGVDERAVRRQLELARPGVVSAELPADRSAAALPLLPGRRLHGRVPDGLGPHADAVADRARPLTAPGEPVPPRRRAAAARSTATARSSKTTRTGATRFCSTSTSTATRAKDSAPRTKPAGPA